MKVVIIDDEAQVRRALGNVLLQSGFDVEEASNGQKGMALLENEPVEIVLTDIFMPDKDGIETIRELKRRWPTVKIIAMSGQPYMLPVAKVLGADQTLAKPFERHCLLNAIHSVLHQPAVV